MEELKQEVLRAKQAAKLYGVGLSTMWSYAKQGLITPVKITDRVTIFRKTELDKFFKVSAQAKRGNYEQQLKPHHT